MAFAKITDEALAELRARIGKSPSEGAPAPLPAPLMSLVSEPALRKVTKLADGGHPGARQLATCFVGQGVGLMNTIQDTRTVVREFMEDYLAGVERLSGTVAE